MVCWGWVGLFVRMRRTTPRVRLPVGFFKYDLHLLSGADVRTPFAVHGAFLLAVYRMRRFAAGRFA